jgi:hypothetical protein
VSLNAELSALFKEYAGSYVMTFAGYNAGRGRVRQWLAQHGDPRDPNVDEVDWVERIRSPRAQLRGALDGGDSGTEAHPLDTPPDGTPWYCIQ